VGPASRVGAGLALLPAGSCSDLGVEGSGHNACFSPVLRRLSRRRKYSRPGQRTPLWKEWQHSFLHPGHNLRSEICDGCAGHGGQPVEKRLGRRAGQSLTLPHSVWRKKSRCCESWPHSCQKTTKPTMITSRHWPVRVQRTPIRNPTTVGGTTPQRARSTSAGLILGRESNIDAIR
jgi:hypothetical protein